MNNRNWETCFLCAWNPKDDLCCIKEGKPIKLDFDKTCEGCDCYITVGEARKKILLALGKIKHYEE